MKKDRYLRIRIPEDFKASIEKRAREERRTVSDLVRIILEDWVDDKHGKDVPCPDETEMIKKKSK